jgi:alpha-beta hydrolase superfamily lysophospholipase
MQDGPIVDRRAALKAGMLTAAAYVAKPSAAETVAAAVTPSIVSNEYWVSAGDVTLYLFRKRDIHVATPPAGKPVLFLAHGSSVSSVPTFDLRLPAKSGYSMMDAFAAWGFDVWTMDFEGYGRSSRTGGNSDLDRSVYDIQLAVPLIQKESKQTRFHYYGESAGALRVGYYAQQHSDQVLRLGLASLSYTGDGSPTLTQRKKTLPFLQTHDRRPRDRDMITSIFTRDEAGTYDPAVPAALADMELKLPGSDSVPTGSYVDMTTKLPILDPKKAVTPFLLIRGEFDGIATEADVMEFFQKAATPDRAFQFVPGATHAVGWGKQRQLVWNALHTFLMNAPVA